jgi:hypothetical protein
MLLLRRARPAAAPEPTDQLKRSHTLVPMTGAMARAWPVHARRCLYRLPERLRWAAPLLDPDHPSDLACTQSRRAISCSGLHHLPSFEHPIVGCHRRRPA